MREYDVIIIGGGTSGAISGITCGREGLKTLIIEKNSILGGSQTAGMVTPMMPLLINDERLKNISGLNNEISKTNFFEPESLKIKLEEMAVESGIDILYDTVFLESKKIDGDLESIVVYSRNKKIEIKGKYFIDASGDAVLAVNAGIEYEQGRGNSKLSQPTSLRFEVGNVNIDKFIEFLKSLGQIEELEKEGMHTAYTPDKEWPLTPIFELGIAKGLLKIEDAKYFQGFTVPGKSGAFYLNCPELDNTINVMDGFEVSKEIIKGHQTIKRYMEFFREMFPGFENAHISQISNFIGIRESIRIKGDYILSKNDIVTYKKQKDSIARCNWYMDIHGLSKEEQEQLEEEQKIGKSLSENEKYYDIPYRTLYSKNIKNLLVVGRCISVDFEAQSSMRIQAVCRALGEAAGYACKIALDKNKTLIDITGEEIQIKMIKNGANF